MTETRQTSPGVSMTTINPVGQRPVCAGCSTTYGEHCQTCGTCPTKQCQPICADMKAAAAYRMPLSPERAATIADLSFEQEQTLKADTAAWLSSHGL